MRILAVGAHPDDIELGCGATLARHALSGDEVHVAVVALGRDAEQREALPNACKKLGVTLFASWGLADQRLDSYPRVAIIEKVEDVVRRLDPELVFTHFAWDRNLDHRVVYDAVSVACRPYGTGHSVRGLLCFEVPSATEWGDAAFKPTLYVAVSGQPFDRKLQALACYDGEMKADPHPRSLALVQALARVRGSAAGLSMAEAFVPVRMVR